PRIQTCRVTCTDEVFDKRSVNMGDSVAVRRMAGFLGGEDGKRMMRYGLDLDGSLCAPWRR
ncbi:hypothetical protein GA0115260_102281, partial [Streptomyces sp. MnatMP-M27]|uniref:hypothetical protein n=1 Tax=Streptomyces sp. MnatMP-M27 TaxID=1839768 RepID=UPI00081E9BB3